MGIFDNLKNKAQSAVNAAVGSATSKPNKSETFTFAALPESLDQMKALPEAALDTPFKTAALTVCALCAYAAAPQIGTEMLNWLKGPVPLSQHELQFLRDRFSGKTYVPFSYFKGATPENNYTPSEPFTITVSDNPYSYTNAGFAVMHLASGGADSLRPVNTRQKGGEGGQWFLTEQFLLADIRTPKAADPWA